MLSSPHPPPPHPAPHSAFPFSRLRMRMEPGRWCLQPIEQMQRPSLAEGCAQVLEQVRSSEGIPGAVWLPHRRLVPAWKFTAAAAAGCPGSLRCPDVGAGAERAPALASSH